MLGDDTAVVAVDQLLGKGVLVDLVEPVAQLLHIDSGVGVDGLDTQGKAVNAGAGLSVLSAVGGHIAHIVIVGLQALQASGNTCILYTSASIASSRARRIYCS